MGIIYLLQPVELIGTSRYKIGCSSKPSLDRCIDGYKNGSPFFFAFQCNDPLKLEEIIKKEFNKKFKLIGGCEYFEGNEDDIKNTFLKLYLDYINYGKNTEDIVIEKNKNEEPEINFNDMNIDELIELNKKHIDEIKELNKINKSLKILNNDFRNMIKNKNYDNDNKIVSFGKESYLCLDQPEIRSLVNGSKYQCFINYLDLVHFNKTKPQYHNMYMSNKEIKNYINVYIKEDDDEYGKVVIKEIDEVLEISRKNLCDILEYELIYYNENNDSEKIIINKIKTLIKFCKEQNISSENSVLSRLFNNRHMVETKIKSVIKK